MFVNEFIVMFFGEICISSHHMTISVVKIKNNSELWNNVGAMQKCPPLLKLRPVLASG